MKVKRASGSMTEDEVIDLAIDTVLGASMGLKRLSKKILRAQRQLRSLVDDDAWRVYMRLEELANERASLQMELLARWAVETKSRRLQ